MKFFLLLLLLGVVVVVRVLRGRRGWKVAALLLVLVVVLLVLRVVMMGGQLILFWEDLLRFRRCLKMMKKKKRLKRLVFGRISIDWSLREGAVNSFEKGPITIFSARLALVASFLLFDFLRRHHGICVGGNRWERVDWLKTEVWFAGCNCLGAEISLLVPFCFLDFRIFTSSSRPNVTTFKTRGHWWDNIGILQKPTLPADPIAASRTTTSYTYCILEDGKTRPYSLVRARIVLQTLKNIFIPFKVADTITSMIFFHSSEA